MVQSRSKVEVGTRDYAKSEGLLKKNGAEVEKVDLKGAEETEVQKPTVQKIWYISNRSVNYLQNQYELWRASILARKRSLILNAVLKNTQDAHGQSNTGEIFFSQYAIRHAVKLMSAVMAPDADGSVFAPTWRLFTGTWV